MKQGSDFVLFGGEHLLTLVLMLVLALVVSRVAPRDRHLRLAWLMVVLLIAQEVVKLYVFVGVYDRSWKESLPLDLCRANQFLCVYMLVRHSYRVFEVAYFWAMGGSLAALITPDIAYGFPDPRFLMFFFSHGLVVLATLYAIFGYGFRPRLRSIAVALGITGGYALIVGCLNYLLDTNYLFLRAKPEVPTVLDLLGPSPIYVLGLFGLAILVCFLCYAPFALTRRNSR